MLQDHQPASILLVDDEAANRKLLNKHLARMEESITILQAASGEQGLSLARERRPDLILLDIMMPGMDGFEVCRHLKEEPATQNIPVIFLSSLDDVDSKTNGFQAGGVDYVSKPFEAPELLSRVRTHLQLKRSTEALQHYSERLELEVDRQTKALQESNEFYRAIFETTQNATCIIDESGTVALCNSAFSELFKQPKEAIIGHIAWQSFVHPDEVKTLSEYRTRRLKDPYLAPKSYEFRFSDSQGRIKNMLSTADLIPGTQRIVISLMDITERKQFEAELERRAFYDSLTGLPNRALFMNRLSWAMERYRNESRYGYAILFLDLDRFRVLNESLGHDVGDQLLQAVATNLESSLDAKHTVARFGGDEFTVLLEETSGFPEVARLAERLQSGLNRAFSLKEHDIHTTCSIGIVLGSKDYQDEGLLVRDAETAMQRAKIEGQNSIKAFNPEMHAQALKFLHLDTELRQALSKGELAVFYQPIIELAELRLVGFEGLVRWHHPHRGLLMPGDFISLAEDTDIILPMGKMILKSACHQLKAWQEAFGRSDLVMNINLSARQFSQADLHDQVGAVLQEARIAPECLELEITESDVMQNVEASTAMLSRIKELGVKLAIDDFGTGYSSLSYLQRFPIDSLKIDRSFVWGLEEQRENLELIKAIVALSRNLGKELIAEGIETQAQLEKLRELGCRFGQGYYFAKPMDPPAAATYLEDHLPTVTPGFSPAH